MKRELFNSWFWSYQSGTSGETAHTMSSENMLDAAYLLAVRDWGRGRQRLIPTDLLLPGRQSPKVPPAGERCSKSELMGHFIYTL